MNKFLFLFFLVTINNVFSQNNDSLILKKIYTEALTQGESYTNLEYLSKKIGHRLSGSVQAQKAVEWTSSKMKEYGFDKVYLQEVMVPHWVRGEKEKAKIVLSNQEKEVKIIALGGSVGTGKQGITAQVIEVKDFEELQKLGTDKIKGKIVFFNRPMDANLINTGEAYGGAVNQRGSGANEAAKYGAVGVVVRSMTLLQNDFPHTGAMAAYVEGQTKIPAVAISTNGANELSAELKKNQELKFYFQTHCETLPDVVSHNVIGEITGTEKPDEILLVGGHLDSWDIGDGAHDDGAGCMQALEVLRIFKKLNIQPKRTIRVVLFMNEENGLRGGKKYAEAAKEKNEKHIMAIESDSGGLSPEGFGIDADEKIIQKIQAWKPLFAKYKLLDIEKGWGGADIGPLKNQGVTLMSLRTDSQRYFDYHHSELDVFENVHQRELELGAAAMASILYLISEYGL